MGNFVLQRETQDFPDTTHVKALEEFEVTSIYRYCFDTIQEYAKADCFISSDFVTSLRL